jgi:hypothetical protein
MSFIQNLFTSRDNNAQGNTYVGQQDRIWWNPDTNAFYYSDGNTAGGIPIGGGGSGVPGGPTNSIQYNLGGGSFGGTANLVIAGAGLSAAGNITAAWFIGNVSATGNVNLGNLYINDQTLGGKNLNANIILLPEGDGWVTVPKLVLDGLTVANTGTAIQFDTTAGIDIQLEPGVGGNILTAGNIKPSGNNVASIGDALNRYTGLWLGAGNINLIDQTLSQNQQIYANNGNLIIANASGLSFGNFRFFGNTMALANAAANIVVGTANATGWVQFNRSIAVSAIAGETAFSVNKNGLTEIRTPATISNTESALNIVGSSSGNTQPRNFTGTMLQITGQDDQSTRISLDAFGASGAQNSYGLLAARAARGTVDSPQQLQTNDLMLRFSSQGWTGNGVYAASIARLNFAAAENFTSNAAVGTYANVQLTPIGSNVIKTVTGFSANGVNFPNAISGGTGNLGITFQDGTFQNTAYLSTNVVSSLTAGAGINLSGSTGDITITNTGILGINGTANRVQVASNVGGLVTLTTPQDLNTTANVTLYSLTVTDLSIIGNVSNVIPSVVGGKIIYVANTATTYNDINVSGLVTGNAANGFSAGMLYDTASNTWQFNSGNSWGITANTVYGNTGFFNKFVHVGYANATIEYANASIQADTNIDNFSQIAQQNHFQGANASSDFVAVANNGDESNYYIDMGINSNVYNNADYAVTKANDGYLYVNGGNLIIGTQTAAKTISFFTGGTNSVARIRGTVSDTGLSMVGNVTANNFIGNAISTTNGISAAGNITGNNIFSLNVVSATGNIQGQNLLTTGVISATANVTGGNLRTTGLISATGNIVTAANLVTATTVINSGISTSGNITGANIITSGLISATGNVNASNVVANLAVISSTLSILGNIQGGNLLTSGVISTTGNAVFGNISTAGRAIFTGNVDAGNLRTTGVVTATGNVSTAGFFVGDGGFISNITTAASTKIVNGTSWANIAALNGNLVMAIAGNTIGTISAGGANITGYANVTGNVTGGNLAVTGISNLNANANVKITGGANAQALITDGSGNLSWANVANIAGAPATQIVSTFTPTLEASGGGTFTYTSQIGNYVKSGRNVSIFFTIGISGVTGVSGTVRVANLPFQGATVSGSCGGGALDSYSFATLPIHVTGTVGSGSSHMDLQWHDRSGSTNTLVAMTTGQLGTTATLTGRITYISAS